jgi:hypothetical protein
VVVDDTLRYAYLRPNYLLYNQKPASPTVLWDTYYFRILDHDPLQGPVVWDFQCELELVFVDIVRRGDLIDSARHFDGEVFSVEFFEALWALDVGKFGRDDDRGEVRGRIVCNRRRQVFVSAIY